ncbi:hypothetical protein BD779DRAFT_1802690 [Infundibulicybe gibba]|nr:hypothetical protein BD779DRAFT_1802690 [Infundibulicybe gibba]
MSSTTSPMPTISSYFDDGTLSPSQALAWKFYAFGMLAIFTTGILGTVIYLGCFRLRKPAAPLGDIEASNTAGNGIKPASLNEHGNPTESCDVFRSVTPTFPLSSSTTTLVSPPQKAYTAARGEGSPREPRGTCVGSYYSMPAPTRISEQTFDNRQ